MVDHFLAFSGYSQFFFGIGMALIISIQVGGNLQSSLYQKLILKAILQFYNQVLQEAYSCVIQFIRKQALKTFKNIIDIFKFEKKNDV